MCGTWEVLQCVYSLYSKGNQVQGGEETWNSQAQDKLCWGEIERLFVFLVSVCFEQPLIWPGQMRAYRNTAVGFLFACLWGVFWSS